MATTDRAVLLSVPPLHDKTATAFPDELFPELIPAVTFKNYIGSKAKKIEICVATEASPSQAIIPWEEITNPSSGNYAFDLNKINDDGITYRDVLRNFFPNSAKNNVRIYLKTTTTDGTVLRDYKQTTFTIYESIETKPCINSAIYDSIHNLPENFSGVYVQDFSALTGIFTYSPMFLASITDAYCTVEGKKYRHLEELGEIELTSIIKSHVFTSSGSKTVVFTVVDSRGFTNTVSEEIKVLPYFLPLLRDVNIFRSNDDGNRNNRSTTIWVEASRKYSKVINNTTQLNYCELSYRFKSVSEEWNDETHLWSALLNANDNTDSFSGPLSDANGVSIVFPATKAFSVQLRVQDTTGKNTILSFDIPTAHTPFHVSKNGRNVWVGGYADESTPDTFGVEFDSVFKKEIYYMQKRLVDVICPVGMLYFSAMDVDPSTIYPETIWEKIEGRFLLSSSEKYGLGEKGGEESHLLTEDELPSHSHGVDETPGTETNNSYQIQVARNLNSDSTGRRTVQAGSDYLVITANTADADYVGLDDLNAVSATGKIGGGKSHNNMPPYLVVHVWKRVS